MRIGLLDLAVVFAFLCGAALDEPACGQVPGYANLFEPPQVLNLNLQMDPADWTVVKNDGAYETVRPAYFWADGENKILVSVRRKPTLADGDKVSLKIDINEYFDGLQWHGVKKLSLENGHDGGPVKEGLAWQLHRLAAEARPDYQTPLASWVNITVNGQRLGIYTNVEQPDKMFLRNRDLWTEGATWLYKQGDIGTPELHLGSGDSPTYTTLNYKPFQSGKNGSPPPVGYEATVAQQVDMRQMLTLGAINAFTGNEDELFTKGKNIFFVDYEPGLGQRDYLPWDLDSVFNTMTNIHGTPNHNGVYPDYQQYILNNPAFKGQYDTIMLDLLTGPLSVEAMHARLRDLETALTPSLLADPGSGAGGTPAEVSAYFTGLRTWVANRHANIMQQLGQTGTASTVPEPAAWMILLAGAPALLVARHLVLRRGAGRSARRGVR